ncbi:molecular chaperone GrpE [Streptosporangium becharense]|uniref:Protein GrpE n=1 Tax=Streptosporangium becharense TaxID=1816182 RepID=A0A7W9IG88_9ACTN|nr:nucleotide exchange factor GrpE [Streptosporangium becharense]MBB2909006.1 molecular chaperone GrpE [Streptosporangium becharense]MBB5819976.1 molecular chaperone GrpE [Streptosporangium becharense]
MSTRENGSGEEPVIRDNRKIDPETGQPREASQSDAQGHPGGGQGEQSSSLASDLASIELATQLAERTADLQRLQAEYSNYRKRVDRDRTVVKEQAVSGVLAELLPVLDDIGRAREHGELTGGFAKVSESLEAITGKLGLSTFGTKGEPFDPTVHEALMHSYSADVTEPTCVEILQPGYRIGERVLRPARVSVAEPEEPAAPAPSGSDEN